MKARMRLGDLLIQAKLVTAAQVAKALELQAEIGGRLGERLVGIEAITREVLDSFIHRMPTEPHDLAADVEVEQEVLAEPLVRVEARGGERRAERRQGQQAHPPARLTAISAARRMAAMRLSGRARPLPAMSKATP